MRKLIVLAIALYAAGFVLFVLTLPEQNRTPQKADGIVDLTGGDTRLGAAVALLETRHAKRLLVSGVHPNTTKADLKRLAHGGARFDCCADLGYAALDTHGNAQEAASWAHRHGYKSLIVVTARYHMPRSLAEFRTALPDVALEPYPVEPESVPLAGWWHDWRALRVLHGEYAKYLVAELMSLVESADRRLDPPPERGKSQPTS